MAKEQQSGRCTQNTSAVDLDQGIPFPDEVENLSEINRKLDTALQEADASVERLDKEYMDAKRYMVQYRGEIDPHEMFQNELVFTTPFQSCCSNFHHTLHLAS